MKYDFDGIFRRLHLKALINSHFVAEENIPGTRNKCSAPILTYKVQINNPNTSLNTTSYDLIKYCDRQQGND